jgi:outer membrane protein assembly factor BamE
MIRRYYDALAGPALAHPALGRQKFHANSQELNRLTTSRRHFLTLLVAALAVSGGCVYRANISQGNLVKQEDLDQLEAGMTRGQVRFLLGTPMIDDPFHRDRWDYVYFLKIGRKDATFKRWVSVYFEDEKVSEIRRDLELDPGL